MGPISEDSPYGYYYEGLTNLCIQKYPKLKCQEENKSHLSIGYYWGNASFRGLI